jgi:hypothetical protein
VTLNVVHAADESNQRPPNLASSAQDPSNRDAIMPSPGVNASSKSTLQQLQEEEARFNVPSLQKGPDDMNYEMVFKDNMDEGDYHYHAGRAGALSSDYDDYEQYEDEIMGVRHRNGGRKFLREHVQPLHDPDSDEVSDADPDVLSPDHLVPTNRRRPSYLSRSGDESGWFTDHSAGALASGNWTSDNENRYFTSDAEADYDMHSPYPTSGGEDIEHQYQTGYFQRQAQLSNQFPLEDVWDWRQHLSSELAHMSAYSSASSMQSFRMSEDPNDYYDQLLPEELDTVEASQGDIYPMSDASDPYNTLARQTEFNEGQSQHEHSTSSIHPPLPKLLVSTSPIKQQLQEVSNDDPFLLDLLNMNAQHFQESLAPSQVPLSPNAKSSTSGSAASASSSSKDISKSHGNLTSPKETAQLFQDIDKVKSSSQSLPNLTQILSDRTQEGRPKRSIFKSLRNSLSTKEVKSKAPSVSPSEKEAQDSQADRVMQEPKPPSVATLRRSEKAKEYFEARYKYIEMLDHAVSNGAKVKGDKDKLRYNPLAVLRWRREAWQRAVRAKHSGGDESRKWRLRQFSWYVVNSDLKEYYKDAVVIPGSNEPAGAGAHELQAALSDSVLLRLSQGMSDSANMARTFSGGTMTSTLSRGSSVAGDLNIMSDINDQESAANFSTSKRKQSDPTAFFARSGTPASDSKGERLPLRKLSRPFAVLQTNKRPHKRNQSEPVAIENASVSAPSSFGDSKYRKKSADLLDLDGSNLLGLFLQGSLGPPHESSDAVRPSNNSNLSGEIEMPEISESQTRLEQTVELLNDINPTRTLDDRQTSPIVDDNIDKPVTKRPSFQVGTGVKGLTQLLTGRRKPSAETEFEALDNSVPPAPLSPDKSAPPGRLSLEGRSKSAEGPNFFRAKSPLWGPLEAEPEEPSNPNETSTLSKPPPRSSSKPSREGFFTRTKRSMTLGASNPATDSITSAESPAANEQAKGPLSANERKSGEWLPSEEGQGAISTFVDTLTGAAESFKKRLLPGKDKLETSGDALAPTYEGNIVPSHESQSEPRLQKKSGIRLFGDVGEGTLSDKETGVGILSKRRGSKPMLFWVGDDEEQSAARPISRSDEAGEAGDTNVSAQREIDIGMDANVKPRRRQNIMKDMIDSIRPRSQATDDGARDKAYEDVDDGVSRPRSRGLRQRRRLGGDSEGGEDGSDGKKESDFSARRKLGSISFVRERPSSRLSKSGKEATVNDKRVEITDDGMMDSRSVRTQDSAERRKKKSKRRIVRLPDGKSRSSYVSTFSEKWWTLYL